MNSRTLSRSLLVLMLLCSAMSFSQTYQQVNYTLTEVPKATAAFMGTPQIQASEYKVFQMDIDAILAQMDGVAYREEPNSGFIAQLSFPHPDGTMHDYQARANHTMDPALAALFPEINSYDAAGVNNGAKVKWDITPHGFHAMIMLPNQSTIFIDPLIQGNTDYYIVYHKEDFFTAKQMLCEFEGQTKPNKEFGGTIKSFGTCELRTYRAAIAATGEYTTFHGGTAALAQAAQVTTMNRVNGVYERSMAVTMTIVANNNLIVYTNSGTDPYTNGTPGSMINENQSNIDGVIGSGNYDIGHVFGTNSGGLAGLGVVCSNGQKARGVTGSGAPIGDPFDIDYVAHEMGHQFGCNHTFNNSCGGNRNNGTAMEPGSGSTIMAYAGICAPDVQSNSDDHFHGISLEEMGNLLTSTNCAVTTVLANSAPSITGTNGNITVPANTPFALTAIATDPDGDVLSYCWEQMDNEISTQSPVGTSTGGPNFRSNSPINDPTRYFPNLVDLAAGGPFTWEVVPTVTRTMDFRVTVRDQSLGVAGCNDHSDVTLTTDAGSGPFIVQYPSVTGIVWAGLTSETVTWDVANTDVAPVACALVDILLSTDGGLTYPTVLATGVANDGSQLITVPNVATTTARIMVICSNGTFFDISDNNFEITMATFDYILGASPLSINICQPNDAVYTVNIGSVGGYNDPVALTVTGVPAGATSVFSVSPVTPVGTSTLTISNTAAAAPGSYTLTITGNSTTGIKTTDVELIIASGNPTAVTQIAPTNGATGVSTPTTFTWTTAPEIGVTYEIDIATDPGFTSIVDQATGLATASHTSSVLLGSTTYYWRVRAVTGCGQSAWSTNFNFTTSSCSTYASVDVGQLSNVASFTSVINVTATGTITDANVALLDITHAYIGDLSATLTSPLGTVIQLFDGPGRPASTWGCNQADIDVAFDDAAVLTATDFENTCNGTPPAIGGAHQSMDPMANVNGESITGTWTLTVFDNDITVDHGTLNAWSLELCTAAPACTDPDLPTVADVINCTQTSTTLSITAGNLNDATSWEWYTGSCGGASVGTGTSITVNPSVTTTYYVHGEGGCVTPGACTAVTITVGDANPPTITCPGDQTEISGAGCTVILPDYTSLVTAIDDCDASPVITQVPAAGSTITTATTITMTATDATGNQSTCTFLVTPIDNTAPIISCPGNQTTCLATMPDYTGMVTISDDCDISPVLTQSPVPGTAISGTVTVTMTGTDASSNVSSCTFDVTAYPTYNEVASASICQGDTYTYPDGSTGTISETQTSVLTSINGCDSTIVTTLTVDPIASSVSQISPVNGATGIGIPTTFTWTTAPELGVTYEIDIATDAGFVSIVDQATGLATATYISSVVGANTTYYWRVRAVTPCGASAWSSIFDFTTSGCFQYTATDVPVTIPNAAPVTVTSTIVVPIGGTINDVNVIDLIGNHTRIKELIITLTSPLGTVVTLMDQVCNNQNDFDVDFDDAAASAVLPCPPVDGNAYQPNGLLSDFNGESATGNWILTITDVANFQGGTLTNWILEVCVDPPVLCTDPDIPTLAAGPTVCPNATTTLTVGSANLNDATSWEWYTGSCGGTSVGSGATLVVNPAVTTTYYVHGEGGCVTPGACASVTVTVDDSNAPTVTCPGNQIENFNASCQFTLPDYTGFVTVIDDCDASPVITQAPAAGSIISGNTTIMMTATDASGNSSTCTFDVVPNDVTPPTISCPADQTEMADASCVFILPDYTGLATATDNCGTPTVTQIPVAGTTITGTTTITLTADDGVNTTSCNFIVFIVDNTAPVITCPGDQSTCLTTMPDYTAMVTAIDNCGTATVVQSPAAGTPISGITLVTMTATDANSNGSSCTFNVLAIPSFNETATATICGGQTYSFGTQTLTSTGVYTELFTSMGGCDSTVILTLTVNPTYNETATASICAGDTYVFGTQTLTAPGVYTELFSSVDGCDSTVILTLNSIAAYNETATATICEPQTYNFGTQTLTSTGVYTELFTSTSGCDSTVVLALTVNPLYNETVTVSICAGDTYIFGTQTLTAPGVYNELFSSVDGCDSMVILILNSITAYNETTSASICAGQTYSFGTQTLTSTGVYTELFTSTGGCDSTVILTLTVNPTYNETATASICAGDTYVFGTQTLTAPGVYTELFSSVSGCDSLVILTLSVNSTYSETATATICGGQTYSFGAQTLTSAGVYTELFTSTEGCDSTVVLTLTVNPTYNEIATASICTGDTYIFGTQTLTAPGVYTELFSSVDGCDSTVILTLNSIAAYNETATAAICAGQTYSFGTQTLTSAGVYTELFSSTGGCDSTVILTLTVNPTNNETATASICAGDTYIFGTQTLTAPGVYTELFSSVDGCDSTVILTLNSIAAYNETAAVTICSGQTYSFGSQTLTSAGVYTELFTSIGGCDSTVILTLTVNPTYSESASASICSGDTYIFGTQTLTAPGVYTELFSSVGGCDSTVILTLNSITAYNETASATICAGQTYSFGAQTLTSTGVYTELFSSAGGCDSTVILTLTVNPTYNETATASICSGDTYIFGTQTLTGSGIYTEVFSSIDGCDSTVLLALAVNSTYNETATVDLCVGQTYSFGTQTLTAPGVYTELFSSINGCDSLVILTLNFSNGYLSNESATICEGQTYLFPDGTLGTMSQIYTSLLTSTGGCDSTIITTLTVVPTSVTTEDVEICEGSIYTFPDGTIGTTTQAYTSVLSSSLGCDSIIVTALTVHPAYSIAETATICDGDTYTFPDGTTGATAQTYTSALTTVNGCDSIIVTILDVQTIDNAVTEFENTLTASQIGATYQWIDCDDSNNPIAGEVNQSFTATAVTGYYAVIITIGNCSDTSDCYTVDYTGLEDLDGNAVNIYPNPTDDIVNIEWEGEVSLIEVTDARGRIVYRIDYFIDKSTQIDLTTYGSGVYFIHIQGENGRSVYDVMKH
ncbi:MAG: M12 family metallo-peptidase [Crocinitomicaceae bacterium]|nr:M12 family metallo-peptidase [Crocinitomicaceae bacterium]